MKSELLLNSIDPALVNHLTSRRGALASIGKLTAGLFTVPVVLATLTQNAFGKELPMPFEIFRVLHFALLLEHLEDRFYSLGLKAPGLIPEQDRPLFRHISADEGLHVKLLAAATVSPITTHTFDYTAGGLFPDVFTNYATFLAVAQTFEDTGVRGYKGQAPNLMGADIILSIALRIHSVEARHAAQIRRVRNQKSWITGSSRGNLPACSQPSYDGNDNTLQGEVDVSRIGGVPRSAVTEAFDEPLTRDQVVAIVQPFIREPIDGGRHFRGQEPSLRA